LIFALELENCAFWHWVKRNNDKIAIKIKAMGCFMGDNVEISMKQISTFPQYLCFLK